MLLLVLRTHVLMGSRKSAHPVPASQHSGTIYRWEGSIDFRSPKAPLGVPRRNQPWARSHYSHYPHYSHYSHYLHEGCYSEEARGLSLPLEWEGKHV
jgi:hypothetical protein